MCKDPSCDKEIKQCEIMAKAIAGFNGRCAYHDGLVKAVSTANGKLTVVLVIQGTLLAGAFAVVKGWL